MENLLRMYETNKEPKNSERLVQQEEKQINKILEKPRNYTHYIKRLKPEKSNESKIGFDDYIDKLRKYFRDESMETTLSFLYASPLLKTFMPLSSSFVQPIDHKQEFSQIEKALHDSGMQVNYQKHVATLDNLPDVLISNPYVIHFSGHGLKNNSKSIGHEAMVRKNEGDMLLFEDSKLCGVLLSESNLKSILEQCKTNIKVAVVLS